MIEIFKYCLPVVTLVLGWLLAQLGERSRMAREDRRRMKKAIFYLMEVRHHLSFFTGNEQGIRKYVAILRKKFSFLFPTNVTDDQLVTLLSQVLKLVVKDKPLITEEDIKNLSTNYAKSVDSLSEIDPILAFRLQGRHNIQDLLKDLVQRMKISISGLVDNEGDKSELETAFEKIGPNVIDSLLDDLDEIILELAMKIDSRTYKAAKRRLHMPLTKEHQQQLEKFAEKMLTGVMAEKPEPAK